MDLDELETPSELQQRDIDAFHEQLLDSDGETLRDGKKVRVDNSDLMLDFLGEANGRIVLNCRSLVVGHMPEFRVVDGQLELGILKVGPNYEEIEILELEDQDRINREYHGLFESDLPPVATVIPYEESIFAEKEQDE